MSYLSHWCLILDSGVKDAEIRYWQVEDSPLQPRIIPPIFERNKELLRCESTFKDHKNYQF